MNRYFWGAAGAFLMASLGCFSSSFANSFTVNTTLPTIDDPTFVSSRRFAAPVGDISEGLLDACLKDPGLDHSQATPLEYVVVEVDPGELRVAGKPVVTLNAGRVPADQKKGMLISSGYDSLLVLAERLKTAEAMGASCWRGPDPMRANGDKNAIPSAILLAIAPQTPYSTVMEVMYTAGQAQFSDIYIMGNTPTTLTPTNEVQALYAALPTIGPPMAKHDEEIPSLDLAVKVGLSGFTVMASALPEVKELSCASSPCGPADFSGLSSILSTLKESHPLERDVIVIADSDVSFEVLMKTVNLVVGEFPQVIFAASLPAPKEREAMKDLAKDAGVLGALRDGGGMGGFGSGLGGGGSAQGLGGLGSKGSRLGPTPDVTRGSMIIMGPLDKTMVEEVVKRHLKAIRYCYQRELAKDPKISGKIAIKFVIDLDGSVKSASVKSNTTGNAAVGACVASRFDRMKFAKPNGGLVMVTYPFVFRSK